MSKTRDTGFLGNVIKVDTSGNVSFVSGSTTLATINTSGQLSGSSPVLSSSYASNAELLDGLDSTVFTLTSSFNAQTASFTAFTASVNSFTASQLVLNGTYATTGSNTFAGIQTINSNLVVTGSITAQTLVVQTITSSVDFVTGSTRFGSILGNTHVFSGSVTMNPGGLFVSSSGLVGIGTTSPSFSLDVNGSGRFASPSTFGSSTSNGDLTIISNGLPFVIRGRTTYDRPFLGLTWDISPDTGMIVGNVLKFNVSASLGTNSGTTALTILANGKVGIGETSPDNSYQGLTIKGSDPSLRLKTTGGSGWTWIEFVNSSGTNNFSMGVNQTSPYFGIKAGAGMDSVHFTMNSSGNMGMGEGANSIARLNINGSTKINRSFYNWYQGYWTGNSTYWHMKTSMWGGGSPSGNIQYTMSLFKGYSYSYGDSAVREGMYGFHNWVGTIYSPSASGNLFSNVYVSSDGYVVLVISSGSGEAGVTIDWHQAYGYPFVTAQVTAAKLHGSTTGGY